MNESLEALRRERAKRLERGEDTNVIDVVIGAIDSGSVSPRVERAVMSELISKRGH